MSGRRAHSDYGGPSKAKYAKQYNDTRVRMERVVQPSYVDEHGNPVEIITNNQNNNNNQNVLYPLAIEAGDHQNADYHTGDHQPRDHQTPRTHQNRSNQNQHEYQHSARNQPNNDHTNPNFRNYSPNDDYPKTAQNHDQNHDQNPDHIYQNEESFNTEQHYHEENPNHKDEQTFDPNFHVQNTNHYEHRDQPGNNNNSSQNYPTHNDSHNRHNHRNSPSNPQPPINSNQREIYQNYQQQNQNLRQSNYQNRYLTPISTNNQTNYNSNFHNNAQSDNNQPRSPLTFDLDSPNAGEDPPQTPSTYVEKTQKDGEIAAFIQKIDAMLKNCLVDKQYWTEDGKFPLMSWSDDGKSFIIKDPESFTNKVIPAHFRHKNRASFVRQLNQYGFKKKNRMDNDSLINATRRDEQLEYMHPYFLRDKKTNWHLVRRAKNTNTKEDNTSDNKRENHHRDDRDKIRESEMKELIQEVQKFRQEQKAMSEELKEVQQQNARLTDSNAELFKRDKYNKHCLKKLCSLLVNHFRPAQSNNGAPFPEIMGGFGSIMQGLGANGSWVSGFVRDFYTEKRVF